MEEIYYFDVAIRRYRRIIEGLKHGELALSFLTILHLSAFQRQA